MIVVTGGAGFIGSNLVWSLNQLGIDQILVVEDLDRRDHLRNLTPCRYLDVLDRHQFLDRFSDLGEFEVVFHQGACTDTMITDEALMMEANYTYSRRLLDLALKSGVRLVYASSAAVYGDGADGFDERSTGLRPLNLYARSKLRFDQHVAPLISPAESQIVGLRYFNVYGPQEGFKGRMASVIRQFHHQARERGTIRLFAGSENFRRDFIYVGDVVAVLLHFMHRPESSGIFNVGTGTAVSFRRIAEIASRILGAAIEEIPFPDELRSRYQALTRADDSALRATDFTTPWTAVEAAVPRYLQILADTDGGLATDSRPYSVGEARSD